MRYQTCACVVGNEDVDQLSIVSKDLAAVRAGEVLLARRRLMRLSGRLPSVCAIGILTL